MSRNFIRQVLPVGLSVGLLWFVLKDVPLTDLVRQFRQARFSWLTLVVVLTVLSYIIRGARWQLTLQAIGYQPALFQATVALLAGALASMIVPGAGELTRCGTLQRTDHVPVAQGIGSVVAERVIDLLMLVLLIGLTFLLEFRRVGTYLTSLLAPSLTRIQTSEKVGLFALVVITILLGLIYWFFRRVAFQRHPFFLRLVTIGRDLGKGFISVQQLKRPGLFVVLTLLSYGLSLLTIYASFFASSQTETLPPAAALTILTVSSLGGLAVPTQGGLGTYHFLVSRALLLYGMTRAESVVVATFLHAILFGINLLLSSISFLIVPMLITHVSPKSAQDVTE